MAKRNKKQEEASNYNFLLKCIAAITAAALFTAAVIAAAALKLGATTSTLIVTNLLLGHTFLAFAPLLPFVFSGIVIACLLVAACNGNNNEYHLESYAPGYSVGYNPSFFSSPYDTRIGGYNHGHGDVFSSNHQHGHVNHQHGHGGEIGGHQHGHGGGFNMTHSHS